MPRSFPAWGDSGRYRQATSRNVARAWRLRADPDGWRSLTPDQALRCWGGRPGIAPGRETCWARRWPTAQGAHGIRPEVSEAVDFLEFLPRYAAGGSNGHAPGPGRGNRGGRFAVEFPIAIPCGGMAAALAAGDTVCSNRRRTRSWSLGTLPMLLAAGSRATFAIRPCPGVRQAAILSPSGWMPSFWTGGTETALTMLREHPR